MKFKMQLVTETKGAIKYAEILPSGKVAQAPNDAGAKIGVLYMRKTAFTNQAYPGNIEVTIDTAIT